MISKKDPLTDLRFYSDTFTISQVVKYFEKQGLAFTKTMIQNYIRVGVLPAPDDKRYYVKRHLMLLTLVDALKDIYSLDEIKKIFGTLETAETIESFYNGFFEVYNAALKNFADEPALGLIAKSAAACDLARDKL